MNRQFNHIIFVLLILFSLASNAQSLEELRKKKEKTNEQIKYTNRLLEEAKSNEKKTLSKYNILNKQIELRSNLISGINTEVGMLDENIGQNEWLINSLNADLEALKKEYAGMLVFAQRNSSSYSKLLFVLSASNFNQAYQRVMYLRQYTDYRHRQAELINWMHDLIAAKVNKLQVRRSEKESLLQVQKSEAAKLAKEKKEQGKYLTSLQQKQKDYKKKLQEQQRIESQLSREIERIIEDEVKKAKKSGKETYEMTPEQKLVSGQFEQNKKRIPWPVERGVITAHFGVHEHPVLKNIQVKNNGVDITTAQGATARAVFGGEVSRVFQVSGGNAAVIIRHGKYLTVYSNLVNVQVKSGQKVSLKQTIGTIGSDNEDEGKTVLKFQIWRENEKMDPEDWITR